MTTKTRPAIVLTSGGLDSTTCLAIARAEGFAPISSMTFDYGQRHRHELVAAERIAADFGVVEHRVIQIDLRQFGHSALTADIDVPKDQLASPDSSDAPSTGPIPITYVPARNTIFLSYALAWAEVLDARDVFIGVNAVDYSGYPDCRPDFIEAFEKMANYATRMTVQSAPEDRFRIHAPLIHLSKAEIIRRGIALGVDYAQTHSCYDPVTRDGISLACGHCDACLLRKKGFDDAGIPDPTPYA